MSKKMKIKIDHQTETEADKITIDINGLVFYLGVSVDGRLIINKSYGENDNSSLLIHPMAGNEIEVF